MTQGWLRRLWMRGPASQDHTAEPLSVTSQWNLETEDPLPTAYAPKVFMVQPVGAFLYLSSRDWTDAASCAQVLLVVIALIGVPIALKQLHGQATASRLAVAERIDGRWRDRLGQAERNILRFLGMDTMPETSTVFGQNAIELARTNFEHSGTSIAIDPNRVGRLVPYSLLALSPALEPFESTGRTPTQESDYQELLVTRCRLLFPLLASLEGDAAGTGNADLRLILTLVDGYVNAMTDVVEMIEQGDVDSRWFLGKRHYAILREVHVIEPFILWRNAHSANGRWGMRVLSLAQAARQFHWSNALHRNTDVRFVNVENGAEYEDHHYGCIVRGKSRRSRLPPWIEGPITNFRVMRCFSRRTKLRQQALLRKARDLLAIPIQIPDPAHEDMDRT